MDNQITIALAIANHAVLTMTYDGKVRIIEPHASGLGTGQKPLLRAYQTAPEAGWRLFDVTKARDLNITSVKFKARLEEGYRLADSAFEKIISQI